jgi:hypothetical protein
MSKKGAYSSGGGAARRRGKDQAMAAELKKNGVERTSAKCPICYSTVSLKSLYGHLSVHK